MTSKSKSKNSKTAENKNELAVVENVSKAPDGGYGWVVLVASFVSVLLFDQILK
jgi:hypothetical protein